LGLAGHPRRYSQLQGSAAYVSQLLPLQKFITYAALVLAAAQLLFLWNLLQTIWRGERINEANPWLATTLEWLPASQWSQGFVVHRGPCDYGTSGEDGRDFLMQHEPPVET
jgi:cytochrome c oxidase subunit I